MPLGVDRRLLYNVDWVMVGTAVLLAMGLAGLGWRRRAKRA
jgi:hypothetical protein